MQVKHIVWSCAGGLFLMLASVSYAADMPADITASPPPETTAAPADSTVTPPTDSTPPPQVAAETPADARVLAAEQQMASDPCAGASASGSLDCEKLKRRVSTPKAGEASSMGVCTTHMDAKGDVVFDDLTCPSRVRPVVNDPGNVYRIRENPFFSLHIDKATDHALQAEIAGKQGRAIDLLDHAQMALLQAKEAQRAGNLAGLNEGIIQLTEALRLPEGTSVREATAYVRDARKNLHQAAGTKLKPVEQFENVAAYK